MRRFLLGVMLLGLVVVATTPAQADLILDQENIASTSPEFEAWAVGANFGEPPILQTMAQSFTVGIAGYLEQVDVQVTSEEATASTLLFDLFYATGGLPTGSSLANVSFLPSEVGTDPDILLSIDLTSFSIPVSIGDTLAIVLTTPGIQSDNDRYDWASEPGIGSTYAGGIASIKRSDFGPDFIPVEDIPLFPPNFPDDLGFRTYVQTAAVPEPATLLLIGTGLIGLLGLRRKFRS